MPYILEDMATDDIREVAAIERLCFTMPWPSSAYRRELKTPETNRYIVERYISPQDAVGMGLTEPTEANLTSLYHRELMPAVDTNPVADKGASGGGILSRW